jgi:phosphoribosylglycinamide formyltransferase, formyltetrahydrofolate-dependent
VKQVAVLVSGGGTNLQALIDAKQRGEIPHAELRLVVASKPGIFALERASKAGIPAAVIRKSDYTCFEEFDAALLDTLRQNDIDVVVLAGYLTIIGSKVLSSYPERIINVHPSLIPAFCGDGWYGMRPHREVLARGVKVTGATVHLVNEVVDGGRILAQKAVEILEDDTPETLQKRVMEQAEWQLLPAAVETVCRELDNRPVPL